MRSLVILPTYNEIENIDNVLRRVRASVPDANILVVDDGSPDATAGAAEALGAELGNVDLDRVRADGYGFQIEMAYAVQRNGGRLVEIPIEFKDRVLGTSKMSSRIVVEALLLVTWWAVRDLPSRFTRREHVVTG